MQELNTMFILHIPESLHCCIFGHLLLDNHFSDGFEIARL